MNEVVNFIINYIKGYTRNGIRNRCWITNQGKRYLKKALNSENIKVKYENFEKIRNICLEDQNCKELVKNFEKIMDYYFEE